MLGTVMEAQTDKENQPPPPPPATIPLPFFPMPLLLPTMIAPAAVPLPLSPFSRSKPETIRRPFSDISPAAKRQRLVEWRHISGGDVVGMMRDHLRAHPEDKQLLDGDVPTVTHSPLSAALAARAPPVAPVIVSPSPHVEPKHPAHVGAAVLAQGVSHSQYNMFRRLQSRLPSLWTARKALKTLQVRSVVSQGSASAFADLRAIITADLMANPLLRERKHHTIKIGGDGSCDRAEKEDKSRHMLVMVMGYMDGADAGLLPNSLHSHRVLAAAWQKESVDTVGAQCRHVGAQMVALARDGISLQLPHEPTRHYTFSFTGMGDLKWQRMAYGLTSAASMFPCIWCDVRRHNIYRAVRDAGGELGSMYDHPLEAMPTVTIPPAPTLLSTTRSCPPHRPPAPALPPSPPR